MGRCTICDFCDDTGEFSLIQEYESRNYTMRDVQTGDDICNECFHSVNDSLSEFYLLDEDSDTVPVGNVSLKNDWRINRVPKERKGSREGTKKDIYPAVPAGSYNTADGRIVLEQGEFVVHGSPRWHELRAQTPVAQEKGATEAGKSQAIGVQPPPSEGTPASTSGLLEASEWQTKPDALAELLEGLKKDDEAETPTMS